MGFIIEKEKTESTPYVLIDEDKGYMKLEGMSFNEFTAEFFRDIIKWVRDFIATDFDLFTVDCNLNYANSSTTKILFDMFRLMDKRAAEGKSIVLNWHVDKDDDVLTELCEDVVATYNNMTVNAIVE